MKVKNRLKEARFATRMTQMQLWLKSGIHFSTISRIECGYIQPTEDQKTLLAKVLKVNNAWLFPSDQENEK